MRRSSLCCNCLPHAARVAQHGRAALVEWRVFWTDARFAGEESRGKSPASTSSAEGALLSPTKGGLQVGYSLSGYKLRATAPKTAPEEISACYSSSTGHEPPTEPTSAARGPLTEELGLSMSMACESLRERALARHRFQFAGGESLRGLPQRCAGLRRSRDPLGFDRAVPVARSPAQTLRLR